LEAEVMNKEQMAGNLAKLAAALNRADGSGKQNLFVERRGEPRLWCSDLVQIWWRENSKWKRKGIGVLEDISHSGACVQMEAPLTQGCPVRIKHPEWKVEGEVRYCIYREEGYFVGVLLGEGSKWDMERFRPKHMIDPSRVAPKKKEE
jgi:hypothetical protein